MGSGASFYLVGVSCQLSRRPTFKTRVFRGFKLCPNRSSPYLPTGKAKFRYRCQYNDLMQGAFLIHGVIRDVLKEVSSVVRFNE